MGCITDDYRAILKGLVEKDVAKPIIVAILDTIPECPSATAESVAEAHEKRKSPSPWGLKATYVDENGKQTIFDSPSDLLKHLELPLSGIQCDAEGKKCKANSVVDIFRIHGYTVLGDGEPKKAGEGGLKFQVIHPASVKKP